MARQGRGARLRPGVRAYFWTQVAAANGSEPARKQLAIYASRMSKAQIAVAKELARNWKAITASFLFVSPRTQENHCE